VVGALIKQGLPEEILDKLRKDELKIDIVYNSLQKQKKRSVPASSGYNNSRTRRLQANTW
jgi:hypothetical protein